MYILITILTRVFKINNLAGVQRKSLATSTICARYFIKYKILFHQSNHESDLFKEINKRQLIEIINSAAIYMYLLIFEVRAF